MTLSDSVRLAGRTVFTCRWLSGIATISQGIATVVLLLLAATGAFAEQSEGQVRALPTRLSGEWKGDFDGMLERRAIRVMVRYSRTLYFSDKGAERGITADFARDFERYVNKKYHKQLGKRPLTVIIRPTTRDLLLKDVVDGFGDIAAGNLTATGERKKIVDFVAPADEKPISELVLSGPKSPAIATAEDFSGRRVHVRKASSYYESLLALNKQLKGDGKAPATLVVVPDALEDEDMMEMLNAGLLQAIVVDDWKAHIWAQILPNIKINESAALRTGGSLGWAIRKNGRKLKSAGSIRMYGSTTSSSSRPRTSASRRQPTYETSTSITSPTGYCPTSSRRKSRRVKR